MPSLKFAVYDWLGRHVYMTERTFDNHVSRHPEIPAYIAEAQEMIQDPDLIYHKIDGSIHLYRYGYGRDKFRKCYLEVVINYDGGNGVVATYHMTRELPNWGSVAVEVRWQWIAGQRYKTQRG